MPNKKYRVKEFGLIEILCDGVLTFGIHNDICIVTSLKKGSWFNSQDIVGHWFDFSPKKIFGYKKSLKRIENCISSSILERHNKLINK